MDRDEIISGIARLETKVDLLLAGEADRNTRLRDVERKQWYHTGAMAVVALVATKMGFPFIPTGA
jgi:hypothetical protein